MKALKSILLILTVFTLNAVGQNDPKMYKDYDWEKEPKLATISEENKEYEAVVLKDHRIIQHRITNNQANTYKTIHSLVHVNSDAGIEKHNRVYIPIRSSSEIIQLKVRSINTDGKITMLKKENIKELKNVKGIQNVKIFAIEGLEVGGEAEYIYTIKMPIVPYGSEKVQREIPVLDCSIKLYYPKTWTIKTKSYNGLSSSIEKKYDLPRVIKLNQKNIPAFVKEEYAYEDPLYMKFKHKLSSNGNSRTKFFTWNYYIDGMLNSFNAPKSEKVAMKYVKDIAAMNISEEEKIKALENKVKSTIRVAKGGGELLENPKSVVANGNGNYRGIIKLYMYCFDQLGIDNQLVMGSNRYEGRVDQRYASMDDITDLFFYFPKYEKFLLPDAYHMRYGPVHSGLMDSEALFIDYRNAERKLTKNFSKFDNLGFLSDSVNHIGVKASLDFSDDLSLPNVKMQNYSQGYRSFAFRSAFSNNEKSSEEKFIKEVILSAYENYEVKNWDIEGRDIELSSDPESYIKINVEYTTPELVERAGNEYLISIGKLIGKQSELYQEKERVHDIVMSTISNYHHEISLDIPAGYQLEGLESIKIDNKIVVEGKEVAYFKSDYTLEGNKLFITVDEVYKTYKFPHEVYDQFRKFINSAANFNKVTLVMTNKETDL
ncbi:DUF3857 domain-containing protein [Flammeovirga yaeyamensis]|uniref:DUF3857 domain-containing protein n=1 Tax=Flammeovirga yaeyamensis TaxID=367791 RepID=A0AAX1N9J3_9BACT|nr:DUF3857 domain-containing protein [Flammeovirga yaeyamensis]MBB3699489.1 hypothetical protein [Flammeovirga yaeyamensis]NMF35254.1 DUF3857 domain-containing protein [Flammeovirga yaeyamensis]QWG04114.1 DUF3857 domain-containing protein [Flammeovirga yaeyamensis]